MLEVVQDTVLVLLELKHTRSWHMPSMLPSSSEGRNQVAAQVKLETLEELGVQTLEKLRVLLVNEEPEVRKSSPRPHVPVGVNRVLCEVICPSSSTK